MTITETPLYLPQQVSDDRESFWSLPRAELAQSFEYSFSQELFIPDETTGLNITIKAETKSGNINGRLNEDSTLITPIGNGRKLVAVLDGTSSQRDIAGLARYGLSGACYVSHLVSYSFTRSSEYQSLVLEGDISAADIMRTMNGWLRSRLSQIEGVDYQDVLSIPGMAATFCLIDAHKNEISVAHVADPLAFAYFDNGDVTELTVNQNERFDIETLNLLLDLSKMHQITPRQVLETPELKSLVKEQLRISFTKKINTPDGCGILNGMDELTSNNLIYETKLPITPDLRKLILASDGAVLPYQLNGLSKDSVLWNLLEDTEIYTIGKQLKFLQKGAAELLRDTEYKNILRLKPSDDATIIEVDFSS